MAKPKKIRGLDCGAPAVDGMRLALTTRFNEMIEWRNAALDWSDPEGVHSMRVASRRLRSAMRDFRPYIPRRSFTSVAKELKTLAGALGEVRDQDVAILALEHLEKHAPPEHSAALNQFIEKRKELREQQRKKLQAILAESEIKKLETDFAAAVAEATAAAERKSKRKTPPPFVEVSRHIIRDRLKEFEKRVNGLFRPLNVEALHDLRITTKRLRYAIELLATCFDRSITAHAKRAAHLQTTLGDLHDCDSWVLSVGQEIVSARKDKAETQLATLVWLLDHFSRVRAKHLHYALCRWREWEAHDASGRLRAAINQAKPAEAEVQVVAEPEAEVVEPQPQIAGEQMRQAL
jgi:CHAD domain-containing protein